MKKSEKIMLVIGILGAIASILAISIKFYKEYKHQIQNEYEDQSTEDDLQDWPNDDPESQTVTMTREECLKTITTEEMNKILEERTHEAEMDLICSKLRSYAKGLGKMSSMVS